MVVVDDGLLENTDVTHGLKEDGLSFSYVQSYVQRPLSSAAFGDFRKGHLQSLHIAVYVPAFPITPSTEIPQYVANYIANGEIDTEFIPVESEHSSMSAAVGACGVHRRHCLHFSLSHTGVEVRHSPVWNSLEVAAWKNVSSAFCARRYARIPPFR